MNFINHGLGCLTLEEHKYLVEQEMIRCDEEIDTIIAEYPKLKIRIRQDEKTIDLNGNLASLRAEKSKQEENGNIARIEFYPKKYSNYLASKKVNWQDREREALETLVTEAGL